MRDHVRMGAHILRPIPGLAGCLYPSSLNIMNGSMAKVIRRRGW